MLMLLKLFRALMALLGFKMHKEDDTLYAVIVISNPVGFNSRLRLFKEFVERLNGTKGLQLVLVELAHGDKPFVATNPYTPFHIQLRTDSILWHKENLINVAIKHLPKNWKYVAWIDADITFHNPHWVEDTVKALQTYKVVQPWTTCFDLGKHGNIMETVSSFGFMFQQAGKKLPTPEIDPKKPGKNKGAVYSYGKLWHPGYAWAARREVIEFTCGLMDFSILGSADHLMALSYVGRAEFLAAAQYSLHQYHDEYLCAIREWQRKARCIAADDVGYVEGVISHHFHGHKVHRKYQERTKILIDHKFNPQTDLVRREDGLIELVEKDERHRTLKEKIIKYFTDRREDV